MELPLIVTAGLFFSLLLWYLKRYPTRSVGFLLIFLYCVVAFAGLFVGKATNEQLHLTLFPSLYFFFVFCVFATPFIFTQRQDLSIQSILKDARRLNWVVSLYVVAAIIESLILIPKVRSIDFSNLLGEYKDYLGNVENDYLYGNPLVGIVYNFISYFRLPVTIIFFTYLTGGRNIKKTRIIMVLFAIFVPNILYAVSIISRAKMVLILISFLCTYLLFYDEIKKSAKRVINLTLLSIGALLLSLFFVISVGRFSDNIWNALLYYLGHSFVMFNDGVVTPCSGHTNGAIFFGWFYDVLGLENTIDPDVICGTHAGNSFCTFMGPKYMDFGPLGTIFFGVFLVGVVNGVMKDNNTSVASLYLYLFYLESLIIGVFYDSVNAIAWVIAFIVFFVLKVRIQNGKSNRVLSSTVLSCCGK